MKLLTIAILASIALPACIGQDVPAKGYGVVTIFREHPTPRTKMFTTQDQWPPRLHKKLTLDGEVLLDMHGEDFASFRLPVGRHSIQWEKYGGPTADFDLHEGERVFVHPGYSGGFLQTPRWTMSIMPCNQALEIGKDTKPMEAKYITRPGVLAEPHFPTSCSAD